MGTVSKSEIVRNCRRPGITAESTAENQQRNPVDTLQDRRVQIDVYHVPGSHAPTPRGSGARWGECGTFERFDVIDRKKSRRTPLKND